MLKLLIKRHDKLLKAKFDAASAFEEQLTELKNEHYSDLVIPN